MTEMTESEKRLCEEVEQYCSKATPGPWEWEQSYELRRRPMWCLHNPESKAAGRTIGLHTLLWDLDVDAGNNPDLQLMARARTDLPKLCALLRERLEAERWIPVSERLPEKDGKYLCWHADEMPVISYFTGYTFWNDGEAKDVTHWRPLPAAPEVQG